MKTFRLLVVFVLLVPFYSVTAQTGSNTASGPKVEAYYFHNTTRCMTCRTVEERAKENLQDLYPEMWKNGTLTFKAADLNGKEGEKLAKKLGVSGQTLLLTNGKKKINLTNEAFLYAVTNPEKYKKVIQEKVDELLK
ncbi:MAG TPA: nitrophenyl compound nitroreductase subunit ArsF family protein [Prolixibacteraceae bacterium]|jgi:hypothetical protein|nr:thioredoxin [Bacteroidales bacterium]HNQ36438.1 nitrophenyl compound nitroreductase subunit ArsF family protein [Prolixibacteraceae bacterium]HPJ79466.1 nitrophenyl compound nitroreductase subunit ArsF family protein [Prolixibacteraceae bacterium]HRV89460.1 nitrophenyl compound nitroreductase subunit ArsF family protein [Prolixibacteraceae bacterium]